MHIKPTILYSKQDTILQFARVWCAGKIYIKCRDEKKTRQFNGLSQIDTNIVNNILVFTASRSKNKTFSSFLMKRSIISYICSIEIENG